MKTLAGLTLAAVLGIGAAHAGSGDAQLTQYEQSAIMQVVPEAYLDNLTQEQIQQLRSVVRALRDDQDFAAEARVKDILGD